MSGAVGAGFLISKNEKYFILKALEEEHRIDGRRPYDYRKVQFQISLDGSSVTLQLGKTLVTTTVTATIETPVGGRPNEGSLRLNLEYSSMAAPGVDSSARSGEDSISQVQQMLDEAIRDIRAVDLEALCILAGRKVWHIRLDIVILDAVGNVTDAAFLCALAALMAFKRPEVTVEGGEDGLQSRVVVHPVEQREALPLTLHQAPMAVTFALFEDGDSLVVDPDCKEEAACSARVTVVMNAHKEVCLLHKAGGLGMSMSQTLHLVKAAGVKVAELGEKLKAALEVHETARVAARVRRRQPPAVNAASRNVTLQSSASVAGVDLKQRLGRDLEDLELAAARESSSDDEAMGVAGEGVGPRQAAEDGSEESGHVGIGVLAPPPNSDEDMEGTSVKQEPATESNPGGGLGGSEGQPKRRTLAGDSYQSMAAAVAGQNGSASPDLKAAVKKKKRKKSGGASRFRGRNTDMSKVPQFQRHSKDTGSSEFQISVLSARISQLSTHLQSNRKDYASRRGLEKLLTRRRHFMQYLYRTDRARYDNAISELNIRPLRIQAGKGVVVKQTEDGLVIESGTAAEAASGTSDAPELAA